jgi:hypothetical protein
VAHAYPLLKYSAHIIIFIKTFARFADFDKDFLFHRIGTDATMLINCAIAEVFVALATLFSYFRFIDLLAVEINVAALMLYTSFSFFVCV